MSGRTTNGTRRTDAGGVEKKAWASGRVLTAEQRQRKQEVDRKAVSSFMHRMRVRIQENH